MRRLIGALLAVALVVVGGCGVRPEKEPTAIDVPAVTGPAQLAPEPGPVQLTVYFVREGRLYPVDRSVADTSASTALEALTAGPSRAEINSGLRTAIPPERLDVIHDAESGTAAISVTPTFAGITGRNQLLAVAQLVWTITELPPTTAVRLDLDGRHLEVPTDDGLSGAPVSRADYLSVAPPRTPNEDTTAPAPPSSPKHLVDPG